MFKKLLHARDTDIGLLVLRILIGVVMAQHGWSKVSTFGEKFHTFPDPLHITSEVSFTLTVFAEFFCSLLLLLGLLTRFAVIPLIINMTVITWVVLGDEPWSKKEFAFLFLITYLCLLFTGPGKYSLDHLLFGKKHAHS
jgi:putative oxidoreductase